MANAAKDIIGSRAARPSTAWTVVAGRLGLLTLLLPSLLQAQTYRSPLDNTVTVAAPADIADPALGNNSATDSNVLALQAQVAITKVITSAVPVPAGGAVQYRITVTNQGPSVASAVTITDVLSAQLSDPSWTCTPTTPSSSCAVGSGTGNAISVQASLGVDSAVVLDITAYAPLATPATIAANTANVVLPPGVTDPSPGDTTATTTPIPVQPAVLVATNDTFATPFPVGGGTTASVLGNDSLRGAAIEPGAVSVALQAAPAGYAVDAAGLISVPAGAPAGRTTLTYQICESISPQNCATATATLVVAPSTVDDSFNVTGGTVSLNGLLAANDRVPADAVYSLQGGPIAGLTVNADGSFTYAPPGGIGAARTFTYRSCLPAPDAGICADGTANILVDANRIVAAADVDLAARAPGAAFTTAPVLVNDTFANAAVPLDGRVQVSLVDAPAGFTIDLASNGRVSVPADAAPGRRVLTYQICETAFATNCSSATLTLLVSPDAVDDAVTTPGAGQPVSGSVAANDSVPAGAFFSLVDNGTRGVVTVTDSGGFTYTPTAGATGADTFSYRVCLPAPDDAVCDGATVNVLVAANALDAIDDVLVSPVLPGAASSESVLVNDVFNGAAATAPQVSLSLDAAPAGYVINADGSVQVPAAAVAGEQTLVYRMCERAAPANCDTAAVQVVVSPQASGEALQATAGVLLEGTVAGNDNPLTGGVYSLLAGPAQGTATVAADGAITYLAPSGYVGADSFQYRVCLPVPYSSVCATATATVTVQASVLLAVDDDFRGTVLTPAGGLTPSVLANDTLNGQAVTAAGVSFVLTGTPPVGFFLESGGELRIPAGAPAGPLQLTYDLCEAGTGNCDSAAITLVIRPEAADDVFSTRVGREVSGNVAVNDNAPAGATYAVTGAVPAGLVFAADGSFTYAPPALLTGVTAFDYQVCLPGADAAVCSTATVQITVSAGTLAANDDDFRAAPIDPSTGGTTNSLLANDTYNGAIPPDPADMLLTLIGAPAGYVINPNATVSIPGGAAAGAVTFEYQMCERALPSNCDTAAVSLLLTPVAANDNFSTQAGVTLSGSVAANDNVAPGSTFAVTSAVPAGLTFSPDGGFVYVPPTGTQGTVGFTYRVCLPGADAGVCAAATVTLNVNAGTLAANDDDFRSTPIDATAGGSTASVLDNDVLEGATPAPAAVVLQLVGAAGAITLAADGTLTVAAGAPAGAVTVDYQLCQAALPSNCDSAQATVLVAPSAAADTFSTPAGQLFAGNVGANDNAPVGAVYSVQGTLPAGLQFNPDGRLLYEPPAGFTGPVAFTYRVCLPAPDTAACSDAVATLNVNAGNVIALDDDLTATPLAPGGSAAVSVLANDTLNAVSPPAPGTVTAALVGAPAGYVLDATGLLQVGAQAPAGLQVLSYQLCEVAATGNCASALIRAVVTPQAVSDAFTVPSGQTFNDAVGTNDNAPADAVYTVASPPPGLLFSGNGSFSYTPQPGTVYPLTFTYQVCLPPPYSAQCASADATLVLSAGTLLATDDDFSATPLSPATGGRTAPVLDNDSLNGVSPPPAASVLLSLTTPEPGVSLDADGSLVIAAGAAVGARLIRYQLCEAALPSNCVTAAARVAVAPLAVADALSTRAGVTLTGNVGRNDAIAPDTAFRVTTAVPAGLTFNADGSFTFVPPAGQTGTFGFSYEVCLPAPDTTVCSAAAVVLNVNNGDLAALADDFTGAALAPGSASPSVLGNDTLNAVTPAPAAAVALSLIGAPAGYTIDAAGAITVPTGVPTGRVTLTYQVCELAAPSNCATADVELLVAPAPVNDLFSLQAGQTLSDTVAANDNVPPGATFTVTGAALAGLTLGPAGGFTYAPPAGTAGVTTFSYQVCLPAPDTTVCAIASVTFNVNTGTLLAADDDFSATPLAGGGRTASVLGNDALNTVTPPDASLVSLSLVNAPAGFSIGSDGVIAIAPGAGSGRTTLTYQVCEVAAATNCDSATATLVVTPAPQPDVGTVAAGGTYTGNVGSNDQVPTGAQFAVSGTAPAGLQFNSDGSFTYVPPAATVGQVLFNYQVCLPAPDSTTCGITSVTLTISAGTLLAVADDFGATPLAPGADTPSVLRNDSLNGAEPVGAAVQLALVNAPAGFAIRSDGTISTPSTLSGASTFDYRICERAAPANCATATVRVVLLPQPADDVVTTGVGVPVSGNVGSNDGVPAGAVFSVVGSVLPGLQFNADGSFDYTPPAGTRGAQAFTYQVCLPVPDAGACSTASVTVNVNLGTLTAVGDDFSTAPVVPGGAVGTSVLVNDLLNGAAPPAGSVVLVLVGAPAGYAIDSDGRISVPASATSGRVSFSYQVCETAASGNCASADVVLLVSPSPSDDTVATPAGVAVTGNVGRNDNVPPGATFSVPGGAPAGLVLQPDGSFVYTPPVGTQGAQTVTYQVCLPAPYAAVCGTADLVINLNAGNVDANDDDFRGTPLAAGDSTPSVLLNDRLDAATPPAPGSVIVTLAGAPAALSINSGGSISVAAGAASGTLALTYQLCEAAAPTNCDTAVVTLVLAPEAVADSISVAAGQTASGNLGSNDNAPVGAVFSVVGPVPAGLQLASGGSFVYTPPGGTTGPLAFTYQVCLPAPDSSVCSTASVAVTVTRDALLAVADDFSGAPLPPGSTTPSVLLNDTLGGVPVDASTVSVQLVGAPAGYAINPDGTVTTPAATSAAVTLTYTLCERAAPTTCATANAVVVTRPAPVADTVSTPVGQALTGNVGSNDGVPAGSVFSVQGSVPPGLLFTPDGRFSYTPPAGTRGAVSFGYQVCLPAPFAAVCGTTGVTINVNTGTLVAADDDFSAAPLAAGATSGLSVLSNDVLDGTVPVPAAVTLSLAGAAQGFAINPDGTLVSPAAGSSGAVTLDYQVCERAAPTNCANARVTVVRMPAPVADVVSTPAGQPVTGAVGSNDGVPPGSGFSVVGTPPPGLQFNGDGSFSYLPPVGTNGPVTFTYQVCLPSPHAAVCGTAGVTVNVNTGNLVAADDDFRAVPLPTGGSTPSVLDNDLLDGAVPAPGSVRVTLPNAPAGITVDADGIISVGAGAVRGAVTLTYQVCEVAAPTNCDSATVRLLLAPAPQPDVVSVAAGASASGNLGSNDNVPPGARFSVVGTPPPGLQFNPDGSYVYTPPAGASGQVGFTYSVCLPAPDAAVCATASATFVITTNVVLAVNDDFSTTPVDPATGGTLSASVLDNDTFNGVAPPPVGSVVAVLVNAPAGFTLNTQGQVTIAPGTASGQYALTYQLCENGAPTNCSTAIATVQVAAPIALLAVDDNAGPVRAGAAAPDLLNVLANDTFNGGVLDPAQVTFAPVATAQLVFAADGSLSVPAGVGVGTWSTTYTICLASQPTVCDTATVSVVVEPGVASVELQDDWVDLPPNGVLEIDVLANDRMEGMPIDPDSVSLALISEPPYGTAEVMPRARIRFAARSWFAGQQTFDYAVCDLDDPSLCAQATVTIAVPVNTVSVADARMVSEGGEPVAWDALTNASSTTAPLDPASLQVVASPANGVAECADGWCTYTPQPAFAGTDSFRYQLCDVSVPTRVCDEGTIAVTVAGGQAVLRLTKVSAKRSAQTGDLVRYTVTVENVGEVDANGATLLDTLPPGFTFVQGGFAVQDGDNSARPGGVQPLRIEGIDVAAGARATVVYYLRVGAGTGTGTHTNRITAIDGQGRSIGNVASAEVEVTADPLLDESLVVGSVFDDRNGNGVQDAGERGIPGVRVAAVEGLLMETDAFGRYHLLGIQGGAARGRNFILKVDTSTLPAGTRFTTPNPLVRRITPGLPARFDFAVVLPGGELRAAAASLAAPLEIELGHGLFVAGGTTLVPDHGVVLEKAAGALERAGGGRLLLAAAPGQADHALQRATVLAAALRTRLTPAVAMATRIDVMSGNDEQVLHQLRVDDPRGAGGPVEEGG